MAYKKSVRLIILVASVIMIIAGAADNGYREVLSKAVMICMECIGIG